MNGVNETSNFARALREVEAYWEALRPSGDIPNRLDIRPQGLENALDVTFILERVSPSVTRFRLAGHKIGDFLGLPAEKVPFTTLFSPSCQQNIAQKVDQVFERPSILRADLISSASIGRPEIVSKLLLLPLRDDDQGITRALGAIVFSDRIGRTPRQFDQVNAHQTRLILNSQIQYREGFTANHYISEGYEPYFAQKERRSEISDRPKFRVIDGDKR